jgi:hypothetical protein
MNRVLRTIPTGFLVEELERRGVLQTLVAEYNLEKFVHEAAMSDPEPYILQRLFAEIEQELSKPGNYRYVREQDDQIVRSSVSVTIVREPS